MPKIIYFDENSKDASLSHYGRLGMKWGQHIFKDSDRGSGKKRQKIKIERKTDYSDPKNHFRTYDDPHGGGYVDEEQNKVEDEMNEWYLNSMEGELYRQLVEIPRINAAYARDQRGLEKLFLMGQNFISSLFTKKKTLSSDINSVTLTKQGKISESVEKGANWVASLFGKGHKVNDTVETTSKLVYRSGASDTTIRSESKEDYENNRHSRRGY